MPVSRHAALRRNLWWLVAAAALQAGCASFDGAPPRPSAPEALDLVDVQYESALADYYASGDPARRQDVRNRYIESRAVLIDRNYAVFRLTLYAQRVGSNVGVDLATLGLNTMGTVVGGAGAKSALHALSAITVGSKATIDKNVYFDRTLPAMLAQMDGLRGSVRNRLLNGLLTDVNRYPLTQASADLEDYYHAGTISGAIAGITVQASIEQDRVVQQLERRLPTFEELKASMPDAVAHQMKPSTDGDKLLGCLRSPTAERANTDAIRAWIRAQSALRIDGPSPETSLAGEEKYAAQRAQLLRDIGSQLRDCAPPRPIGNVR